MPTANELYAEATCFLCYGITQAQALKLALLRRKALELDPDANVTPEALLASSSCYNCYANGNLYDLLELALLAIIADNPCAPAGNVDGLIWGPAPETVDSISGSADAFLNDLSNRFGLASYTTLSFGNPTTVTNGVDFSTSDVMTSLEMRLLETVGSDFNILGNPVSDLETLILPELVSVGGSFIFSDSASLTSVAIPSLQTVAVDLLASNNDLLLILNAPALTLVGSQVDISAGGIQTFSAPALATYPPSGIVADASILTLILTSCVDDGAGLLDTDLSNMTNLETLDLAGLTSATQLAISLVNLSSINLNSLQTTSVGPFEITGGLVTSIVMPSLTGTATDINLSSLPNCTSISLPVYVTNPGSFTANNNAVLTSFSAPVWVPTDGTVISFDNDSLDATSVEHILRRCVLAGLVASTIDLSGGANAGTASLSAQGQADVATLGAQLTINP